MYITSFYSFKGGVGRTVGLLNAGWHLARQGRRVVLLDLDLEAPGLGSARLRSDSADQWTSSEPEAGFCELVREFRKSHAFPQDWYTRHLRSGLGPSGRMALMAASGAAPEATQNLRHFVQTFSWVDFYLKDYGRDFMEALVQGFDRLGFDYLLIDARTGLTDVAGISLRHLPDLAVLFTNLSQQSVDGIGDRLAEIEEVNDECRSPQGSKKRRRDASKQPIDYLLVGSPLPTGEWRSRQERIAQIEKELQERGPECELAVQIDYLPLLALDEEYHILAQHLKTEQSSADELLLGATHSFERLAREISGRNPEDPENLIGQGRRLLEIGLWRDALTHFGEVGERARARGEDAGTCSAFEARLNRVSAQLQSLDAELAGEDLTELETALRKDPKRLRNDALRLAQVWLAVSWTYILVNKFECAVKSAEHAVKLIDDRDRKDLQARSLKALASLRLGYAQGLNGQWRQAVESLRDGETEYARLRTRPLLHCRCLAELALGSMMVGAPLHEVAELLNKAGDIVGDSAESAGVHTLRSGHVKAQLHLAGAQLLIEQGDGVTARGKLSEARQLFHDERDDVGETDAVLAWTSLGLAPMSPNGNGSDRPGANIWVAWETIARDQLRMPRVARRLNLKRLAWKLAFRNPRKKDGVTNFREAFIDLLGRTGGRDDWFEGIEIGANESVKSQDPAFSTLVRLECCRYLLATAEKEEIGERLEQVDRLLQKARKEMDGPSPVQGVKEEAEHDLVLLRALRSLAAGERSCEELESHIEHLHKRGYILREAQARFVAGMVRYRQGSGEWPDADEISKKCVKRAAEWFWNFPLLFLSWCEIPQLKEPYEELCKQLGDAWPQKDS